MEMALFIVGIIIAFCLFFTALWSAIVFGFSHVSGWQNLASQYATPPRYEGFYTNVSGRVGLVSYNNLLRIAFTEKGLYLHIMPFFQIGHTPLLLPWHQLRHWELTTSLFRKVVYCQIDGVRITLPHKYWGTLQSYLSAYA